MLGALFGKQAAATTYGEEVIDPATGNVVIEPSPVVKFGAKEFATRDPQALDDFNSWVAKAKATNQMIPVGETGAHYPIGHPESALALTRAELTLKFPDASPEQIDKAMSALRDQVPPAATNKAIVPYEKVEATNGEEATAAKANKAMQRGPRPTIR